MAVKNIAIQAIRSWKSKRNDKFHVHLPEVLQVTTDHLLSPSHFQSSKTVLVQNSRRIFFPLSKVHVQAPMSFVSTFIINKNK
jgi:hypothetical protein